MVSDSIQILHVDDSPELLDATATVLENEDGRFEIRKAQGADEALDILAETEIDCVVSDYKMPEQNGIEFLETVREDAPGLPFILYTGKGSEAVASEAISAGVTDYLQKESGTGHYTVLANRITNTVEQYRSQQQLETVIDNLPGYVYRHRNEDGWPLEFVKGSSEDVTGYTPDELEEITSAEEIIHPEDRKYVQDAVAEGLGDEQRYDLTYRILTKDDEVRWIWERGKLVENPVTGGDVLEGFITGITDRKERERVLREMYDVFSDRERTFEEQMQALLDIGRRTLDTEYGTLSQIDDGEYLFEVVSAVDDSIQAGDVVPVEATNCEIVANTRETVVLGDIERDSTGGTDRVAFTDWGISCYIGAPVYDDDGVYGTFCFYDTEARTGQFSEWEQTLVELMSSWVSYELERREANNRLQQQNERLEQFASIVSHDLRNPLNVATLRLELAQRDCASDHLDAVDQAHSRMERLIDDLLTLAREGDVAISPEPTDIGAVVDESWSNVETQEATLNRNVSGTVLADDGRLKQVFENLFRNAIEHAGEDVVVTIGDLPNGFYVADNGPGIPEEKRETVFEAGYSTDPQGTGFGLSIVEQVVEAHDLEIAITEGSDGGARFEITGLESAGY